MVLHDNNYNGFVIAIHQPCNCDHSEENNIVLRNQDLAVTRNIHLTELHVVRVNRMAFSVLLLSCIAQAIFSRLKYKVLVKCSCIGGKKPIQLRGGTLDWKTFPKCFRSFLSTT